jgi:hypothetical protein
MNDGMGVIIMIEIILHLFFPTIPLPKQSPNMGLHEPVERSSW